jgi:uncharacterized protein YidB (DUF937 family)
LVLFWHQVLSSKTQIPALRRQVRQNRRLPSKVGDVLGGLGGLLNQFQQSGLGDVVKSWIGPGQNQPISPNQLGTALGPQIIKILAQQTGMSEQEISTHLSQILPNVVDKLTPNGRMPTQAELANLR